MSSNSAQLAPCGGCGDLVGPIHVCPICSVHMHPFCGKPVGQEGFGQHVLCPDCDSGKPQAISAPPIIKAFALQGAKDSISSMDASNDDDAEESCEDDIISISNVVVTELPTSTTSRASQQVTTIQHRRRVISWMEEYEKAKGTKNMFARAVDQFPDIFNSSTRNANLSKAMSWWKNREQLQAPVRGSVSLSSLRPDGRKRVNSKALSGRGRPRSKWVLWIYPLLLSEFDRLRKLGLKFDASLLRQVAKRILQDPQAPKADENGAELSTKITSRWVQTFMENNNIVLRAATGKRLVSPQKVEDIEKQVAYHLGKLKRGFESGLYDENAIENIDETHFVVDFDNGKTLGFGGENQVKYADVVSGGDGMTMVVRISGGPSARILPPMMIFTNADRSYPIRGVKDNVEGVCYRTGPKGWMDKRLFREYLKEPRAQKPDRLGRKKTIFLDNCSSHLEEDECTEELQKLNASLAFFPANATDLCQPADSFVIAKIKDEWRRMWNEKKIELIEEEAWQNKKRSDGTWSGKLKNPGKHFFLSLAAKAVRQVNSQRDKNNVNYARKAMIRCGLSLDVDGVWRTEQLFSHLQVIIKKFPDQFAGQAVPLEMANKHTKKQKNIQTSCSTIVN